MPNLKLNRLLIFSFLLGALACTKKNDPSLSSEITLSIGFQPNESQKDLEPLRLDLEKRTGLKFSFVKTQSYEELVNIFSKAKIDFAFFSPLTFIQAEREGGAKALLKKVYGNNDFYYSALVVKNDFKIKKFSDLKGKKVGFVDPKSTSGFLYPRMMLLQEGFDAGPNANSGEILSHEFFGTHEKALEALRDGRVDVVGVWAEDPKIGKGAWTDSKFSGGATLPFKVLLYSEPIPNDAFAVREEFYKANPIFVFKIMEALIGAGEDPSQILKKVFDVDRMATATSRHYDSVRGLENMVSIKK